MDKIYFSELKNWHDWLQEYHNSCQEIWLIFYKKHTGKTSLKYEEAVEEALCFGWIDSLIKKLDEECYARKFTPRTDISKWSDLNIKRLNKLIKEGRMRPEGLAKITPEILSGKPQQRSAELTVPEYITLKLKEFPEANQNFSILPPSHKKRYIGWIDAAKKMETKQRRLQEAIEMLLKNERLGMK